MGHCDKFGDTVWATVANLVMRYGPPRGMKPYNKIYDYFHAVGHCAGFDNVQRAIVQDWLCAMDHSAGFCYAL
jgi:hypothetical protein